MLTVLAILHIIVCVFLILVVLLQTGRGSDIGAVFGGGGGQALFGSSGPGTFLGKLTAAMAVIFMVTSLIMASNLFKGPAASVMQESAPPAAQEAPATPTPTPAAPEKAPVAPTVPDKAPEKQ
jgi:preprotein translocase subunit SecG